jgi:ribosomal protein S8E
VFGGLQLIRDVEKIRSEVKNEPHQNTYNRTPYLSKDTVIAINNSSELAVPSGSQSPEPEPRGRPEEGSVHGIRPDELVRLAPRLRSYLRRPNPTWSEVIDAADWLRHDLEVSKSLWGDACVTMRPGFGRGRAGDRVDQAAGTFPNDPGRLFPRDDSEGQGPRTPSRSNGVGAAARQSPDNVSAMKRAKESLGAMTHSRSC